MVTIIGFNERANAEGERFLALTVQGGIDMVASKSTGEVISLNHHWEYSQEAETMEEVIFYYL